MLFDCEQHLLPVGAHADDDEQRDRGCFTVEPDPYYAAIANAHNSIIEPIEKWLKEKGVRFQMETRVRDIETEDKGKGTLATALVYDDASGHQRVSLTPDDLVFFTSGSMVQSTTYGDNHTVATYNRDTTDLGVFDVWKKLAARDPKFGRPEPFISDIGGSAFHTFTVTITGDSTFADYMSAKTGVTPPSSRMAASRSSTPTG